MNLTHFDQKSRYAGLLYCRRGDMRPYYPFNSKLFNTTIYSFECPNINDTLSVKACLCKRRQFSSNGAASIQKIHTVQRTSSGSLNIDGRGIKGSKSESYAPSKKCNPSSGVSDTENIARKNPVRRCI